MTPKKIGVKGVDYKITLKMQIQGDTKSLSMNLILL